MLAQTLADVRKRLLKRSKLNENDTKATLVEPVLGALGWRRRRLARGRSSNDRQGQ